MGPGEPCPEIVIRPSSDADVAAMIAILSLLCVRIGWKSKPIVHRSDSE